MPDAIPSKMYQGVSRAEKVSTSLKENRMSSPSNTMETSCPLTEAMRIGMNLLILTSVKMTSIAKMTPAMGELKMAEIAPAAPQPMSRVLFLVIEVDKLPEVGSDGRARDYNGSLQPHRASEAHCDGAFQHVGHHVSFTDAAGALGDGTENSGDAMTRRISYHKFPDEYRQKYTYDRVDNV